MDSRPPSGYTPREGDWTCEYCRDVNFAHRDLCRKCSAPRPGGGYGGGYGGPGGGGGGGRQEFKPGDWMCPDPSCREHNFARRERCKRCNCRKPMGGGPPPGYPPSPYGYGMPMPGWGYGGGYGMYPYPYPPYGGDRGGYGGGRHRSPPGRHRSRSPRRSEVKIMMGDWKCLRCNELNFAKRTECRHCRCEKEGNYVDAKADQRSGDRKRSRDRRSRSRSRSRSGSRRRSRSGDRRHNRDRSDSWTRYEAKATGGEGEEVDRRMRDDENAGTSSSEPKQTGGATRDTMRPGDWICPSATCGEVNFARRSECFRCRTARPPGTELGPDVRYHPY